jgi:N-carbamoylputrescine amidase
MSDEGQVSGMVRVACIQMQPELGQLDANRRRSIHLCEQAVRAGAELLVLPELCNSGYNFRTVQEARQVSEQIPTGPTSSAWASFCQDNGVHLVAGIAERDGDRLFNSSVVIGPGGHLGTFRKVHLWNRENLFFTPGDLGFPVFETPIGRIATFICYDGWFPEAYRTCALRGADLICVPTNWVPIPGQAEGSPAMATVLVQANAHSNSVYVAAADRVGIERDQPFIGQSVIVSYTGWPIARPASPDEEEILYADLDLAAARAARNWNDFNDPLNDRRPHLYDR